MRALVLGASGMLGHKVLGLFLAQGEAWGSVRPNSRYLLTSAGYPSDRLLVSDEIPMDSVLDVMFDTAKPTVVVNCIGAVKQLEASNDPVQAITLNSLLPHKLATQCAQVSARLIHISTDCVFSGTAGRYSESALPDATDLYGRSKLLGEVTQAPHLTLRTSIIGRELAGAHGLLEWFLSKKGQEVQGFTSAYFSGLTTLALARIIVDVADRLPGIQGLYHVASDRIDKFQLLQLLDSAYGCGTTIVPNADVRIDRSLDGTRFSTESGMTVPSWPQMMDEMVHDSQHFGYDALRREFGCA